MYLFSALFFGTGRSCRLSSICLLTARVQTESVEKTGRCVVIHEAPLTCGVGAEIVAQVAEKALFSLKAPPERVAGFDTIVPYAKMEKYYIPSEKRIIDAVNRVMEFA